VLASYRRFLARTVRVHTPNASIEGVLTLVSRDYFILAAAKYVKGADESLTLEGESVIPRESVDFLQVL
jgi:hypothetical protein